MRSVRPHQGRGAAAEKGAILAVKGIGGYHLCCDASSDQAVQLLRTRKNRPHKAFAVMFADLQDLRRYAEINEIEAGQITSWTAPIVVVRRKPHPEQQQGAPPLSLSVSPDTDDIGAFLPYSPLHHLLLQEAAPLVMTSGNLAEEPIAKDEEDLKRLMGSLADAALLHNREIIRRCDDSVIKIVNEKPLVLRRSRGLVPDPLPLPFTGPPVLACGAEMKNTVCVTRGKQAFVSPHIGDLADFRAYRFFIDTINDLQRLLSVAPEIVAHDAHPDYPSTRYALGLDTKIRTPVQHHHAHIASCMAEHGIAGPVIGVALDGTGFGPDGTIWGGEFLVADFMKWRRAAHFKQYRMPGGEQAVLNPVRMALSYLLSDLPPDMHRLIRQLLPTLTDREWNVLPHMIEHEVRSPATSSAGRLFDAAAALLGMAEPVSYEGRAAVRLQALASRGKVSTSYPFHIERDEAPAVVSFRDTIRGMVSDIRAGIDKNVIAASFHNTIADAVAKTCAMIRINERIDAVALSGGVFQNEFLLRLAGERLIRNGFRVYTHRLMPPNDGGISLGQAAVAMARLGNEYVE